MFRALLIAAVALGAGPVLAQVMYRYQDPAGHTVFSDRPPPRGVPYTVQGAPHTNVPAQPPGASNLPSTTNPSVPLPTQPLPSVAVPRGPALPGVPVDPAARRDRDAFVPDQEQQRERQSVRQFAPQDAQQINREATRQFVPQNELERERQGMQTGVAQDEAARQRRDLQTGVPADELRREQESMRLNR
jgi:hypothetical protein